MNRRVFLTTTTKLFGFVTLTGVPGVVAGARADRKSFAPHPGAWHTHEMTTRVEILSPEGVTRAWLPVPALSNDYQHVLDNHWSGNATRTEVMTEPKSGAAMLYAEFPNDQEDPVVE